MDIIKDMIHGLDKFKPYKARDMCNNFQRYSIIESSIMEKMLEDQKLIVDNKLIKGM